VRAAAGALLALALAGCAPAPPPAGGAATRAGAAAVRHVLVVSVDGLRPDFVTPELMPNLSRLRAGGVSAGEALTVVPSRTLPSHTSMWTGVPVAVHGIHWNDDRTRSYGPVRVETAFDRARAAGLTAAMVVAKSKLRHLIRPGSPQTALAPRGAAIWEAMEIAAEAHELLLRDRPHLLFVHFADPDVAGHSFGWGGRAYRAAVRRSDRALGHLLRAAEGAFGGEYVVIVTSDHGGGGRTHGLAREEDLRIPWVAWGERLPAASLTQVVRTCDTAATALALLGVPVPAAWEGVALLERSPTGAPVASGRAFPAPRCE
jgi:arylsulfatase A-like enzyme